jgi:hypothetical protein
MHDDVEPKHGQRNSGQSGSGECKKHTHLILRPFIGIRRQQAMKPIVNNFPPNSL